MDIQQLKSIAGRVRDLLQHSNYPVGHNQSLDLVAALPDLRNWPEVVAFPDRVAVCQLDQTSASRLAFRLRKLHVELSPEELLSTLSTHATSDSATAPDIWPTGPKPGVYVTTSRHAIHALLSQYEDASDGALVYAERAGSHWEGSIDLGEGGLWSNGLSRVPSGTLIVVGPLEFDQQSWEDSANRLHMAALHASRHRVAVLIDTPTPQMLCEDVLLMVRSVQQQGDDCEAALMGVVTEAGELEQRLPFARSRPRPSPVRSVAKHDAIPPHALALLRQSLGQRRSGLLLFGTSVLQEHWAIDLVAASLAITEDGRPAARIMSRHRATPAKDWQVPDAIKQLPYLPSIESAVDQGYRRIVFNPHYTNAETLLKVADKALLIGGAYASDVGTAYLSAMRGGDINTEGGLLARLIAVLTVMKIPSRRGEAVAADLVVMPESLDAQKTRFSDITKFLEDNRVLKWQEELTRLLDSGAVTVNAVKRALAGHVNVVDFLSQRTAGKR